MKSLLPIFLAVLVAAGLSLFVYDRFVLAPRLEQASEQTRANLDEARVNLEESRINLDQARVEAQSIASELDASVDRSVADARAAMDEQAATEYARRADLEKQAESMRRTGQAADALARANMMKVAVVEYQMSMGRWPMRLSEIGMGEPEDYEGGPVASITIEGEGVIAVSLKPEVADGGRLRLIPRVARSGMVEWSCRASDYPEAERLAACKP